MRRRLIAALTIVLLAPLAPARATLTAPTAAPATASIQLPWLHVVHPLDGSVPSIADDQGRRVLLRGVNANGLQDDYYDHGATADWAQPLWSIDPARYVGACPDNRRAIVDPPLCEVDAGRPWYAQSSADGSRNDFAQMRALGFDIVRLTLSWSSLEPQPGHYSQTYLDRVAQVVGWAREQGIYVLLDMHQDTYSRFIDETGPMQNPVVSTPAEGGNHADGAPAWAIVDDGVPSEAPGGVGVLGTQAGAAFTSFWLNRSAPDGRGLQEHYIGAVAALAGRFKDESAVAGFELMNEPQSGSLAAPGAFEQGYLYPFYRRVIDAITGTADAVPCPITTPALAACGSSDLGIHDHHLVFFEPWAIRNLLDVSPQVSAPFSMYPNLVYAPHEYTHVFTADTLTPEPVPYPTSYDQAFTTAEVEAAQLGAALFIGEFGNGSDHGDDIMRQSTDAQDRHLTSATAWEWKGTCGAGDRCSSSWGTYESDPSDPPAQNGPLKPSRVRYLSRIRPRATSGVLQSLSYDPDRRTMSMTATATAMPADETPDTEIIVPAAIATPAPTITVTGAAVLDRVITRPDGARVVLIRPTGAGAYAATVTA